MPAGKSAQKVHLNSYRFEGLMLFMSFSYTFWVPNSVFTL